MPPQVPPAGHCPAPPRGHLRAPVAHELLEGEHTPGFPPPQPAVSSRLGEGQDAPRERGVVSQPSRDSGTMEQKINVSVDSTVSALHVLSRTMTLPLSKGGDWQQRDGRGGSRSRGRGLGTPATRDMHSDGRRR